MDILEFFKIPEKTVDNGTDQFSINLLEYLKNAEKTIDDRIDKFIINDVMNIQEFTETLTEVADNRIDQFTIDNISKFLYTVRFGKIILSKTIINSYGYNFCDYCDRMCIGYYDKGLESDVQILTIKDVNICQECLHEKAENVTKTFDFEKNDIFCDDCKSTIMICNEDLLRLYHIYKFKETYIADVLNFIFRYDINDEEYGRSDAKIIQQKYGKHYLTCSKDQCANRSITINYKPFSKSGIFPPTSILSKNVPENAYYGERIGEGQIDPEYNIIHGSSYFLNTCLLCKVTSIYSSIRDRDHNYEHDYTHDYDYELCKDCENKFGYCKVCDGNFVAPNEKNPCRSCKEKYKLSIK